MSDLETLQTLKRDMTELMSWKSERQKEQIKFPLDVGSYRTVRKDTYHCVNFNEFLSVPPETQGLRSFGIETLINNKLHVVYATIPTFPFSANPANDTLTSLNGAHNLRQNDLLTFDTTGLLPDPISFSQGYYVINPNGDTFQISSDPDGTIIDILDAGTGSHYYEVSGKFPFIFP